MVTIKKVKEFTVDCNKWLRGEMISSLLVSSGKMCCLGFYAKACGVEDSDLMNTATPARLYAKCNIELEGLTSVMDEGHLRDNRLTQLAVSYNDDRHISDELRISSLTRVFNDLGIKVTFINIPGVENGSGSSSNKAE